MKRPAPERNTLHERRFTRKYSGSACLRAGMHRQTIAADVFMNHAGSVLNPLLDQKGFAL